MCVKLSLKDLNPVPYPPHPTSIYTCGVTIAPKVYSDSLFLFDLLFGVIYHPPMT